MSLLKLYVPKYLGGVATGKAQLMPSTILYNKHAIQNASRFCRARIMQADRSKKQHNCPNILLFSVRLLFSEAMLDYYIMNS